MANPVLVVVPIALAVLVLAVLTHAGETVLDAAVQDRLCSQSAHHAMIIANREVWHHPSVVPESLAGPVNEFAMDFYRQVSGDGNVVFSPMSVYLTSSALYEGAGSVAAEELQNAFGFDPGLESRYVDAKGAVSSVNHPNSYLSVSMASGFWTLDGQPSPAAPFAYTVRVLHHGEVESVPAGEPGSERVNAWAAKATRGGITDGAAGPLGPGTSMAVTSAAHFAGYWTVRFQPHESGFDAGSGNGIVAADMLKTTAAFGYADAGDAQVLQIQYIGPTFTNNRGCWWVYAQDGTVGRHCYPLDDVGWERGKLPKHADYYPSLGNVCDGIMARPNDCYVSGYPSDRCLVVTASKVNASTIAGLSSDVPEIKFGSRTSKSISIDSPGRFSLLVVLPSEPDGMRSLEGRLSADLLDEWRGMLVETEVDVVLPTFDARASHDLLSALGGLGVKKIGETGSLPGISKQVRVSDMTHPVRVQVIADETGRDVSIMRGGSGQEARPSFVADRPFLYFIQDTQSGAILFMGKVTDPT